MINLLLAGKLSFIFEVQCMLARHKSGKQNGDDFRCLCFRLL